MVAELFVKRENLPKSSSVNVNLPGIAEAKLLKEGTSESWCVYDAAGINYNR